MGLITSYKLRVSSYAAALFLAASSALGQVVSGPSSSVTNGIPTFGDATGKRIASNSTNLLFNPSTMSLRLSGAIPNLELWNISGAADAKRFDITSSLGELRFEWTADNGGSALLLGAATPAGQWKLVSLSLSGTTNILTVSGGQLLLDGEAISSSAAAAILNFYASNFFSINGKFSKGTFTNELVAIQIGNSKLVATASNGALTNADGVFTTRGSVLYKGASGWTPLVPNTSGYILTDGGVGADPAWAAAPAGGLATSGSAYGIVVGGSAIATNNWVALSNAYVVAKAATPHGSALSSGNRYTIILLPGVYDLGAATFTLDTRYIDIIGWSDNSGPMTYTAVSTMMGDTVITSTGVALNINTTADHDITLANFCLETKSDGVNAISTTQAGFGAQLVVRNVLLTYNSGGNPTKRPMPYDKNYDGQWIDVRCWFDNSFGYSVQSGGTVTLNGTFIRCKGGSSSFGATLNSDRTVVLSGTFIDCEASGTSFGAGAVSTLSGTFLRCRYSLGAFGGASGPMFGGTAGTLSGFFQDCISADSENSWGGSMTGTMIGCLKGTVTWTTSTGTITGCYLSSYKPNVAIAATGWTNLFGSTAVVYFDGTAVTAIVKDATLATIYTNAVAQTGVSSIVLPPKAAVVLSGTGVAGRATVVN